MNVWNTDDPENKALAYASPSSQGATYAAPIVGFNLNGIPGVGQSSTSSTSSQGFNLEGIPGVGPSSTSSTSSQGISFGGAMKAGVQTIGQESAAKGSDADAEYKGEIASWKDNDKYWLDPTSDVKPDLDAYMSSMPSKTQSLSKGTMTGGQLGKSDAGNTVLQVVEPTGGWAKVVEQVGGEKYKGFTEYVGNKAGEGAISGSSMGWQGAIAGTIVGSIMGAWNWIDGISKDDKERKGARDKYERAVKEWVARQNKARSERRQVIAARKMGEAKEEEQKKASLANTRKRAFVNLMHGGFQGQNYKAPILTGGN